MERDRLELLAQVATLYYLDNLSQEQIAAQLGYSRSMISRLLREAREQQVVEIRVHYPLERCADLERELMSRLGLPFVQVIARRSLTYEQMLRRLGEVAARSVESLVTDGMTIGISWGTALREMTNQLDPLGQTGIHVVQIIGALDTREPDIDGPNLARSFAQAFGGTFSTLPAPLIVESATTAQALMGDRSIKRILARAEDMDMVAMGIGTVNPRRSSLLRAGYLASEELDELMAAGIVGDVCGIHFDVHGQWVDVPLQRRRIGISAETLVKTPIKMGIAGGEAKAFSILGACRSKLVNYLVTDETAARRVLQQLKGED
ncbi:MAG TPA: sugar-binding transcriptional regulator [Anaerolineaceae bacterium]|nr:sugar-binding transcriptional regulator [Anaerolineaceae bacterium]